MNPSGPVTMRNYRLFLLLFGIVSSAFAQDYRIINPARDYYYGDMNRVIHIDSVAAQGMDSLYFNYELVDLCGGNGPLPKWLSHPVRTDSAGAYVFENDSSETITLHSQSQPGTVWTLYTFPNGNALEASHTATTFAPFLGITDSVREIVQALKDSLGNPLPSEWNGKSFRLSQNHGLISTYNFDRFPQDTATYLLVGVSHPKVGQTGITAREIFDFEVGDEMQVLEAYSSGSSGHRTYITDRVLSKQILDDTVWYEIDRWTFFIDYELNDSSWTHHVFTQQILLTDRAEFPYESPRSGFFIAWYTPFIVVGGRIVKLYEPVSYFDVQACWQWIPDFQGYCIEGLGCGFYDGSYAGFINERLPIYFSQNGETWGNRFRYEDFITSTDPGQDAFALRLYPNPFHDLVYVKIDPADFSSGASFLLYDSNGRRVLKQPIPASGQAEINTETLPPGIYFYRITATNGTFASGKLVRQ